MPFRPQVARRVNRALHEARRPLQLLALRPTPPGEVARIAAALEEIDAVVNGCARQHRVAPGELRRMRVMAAIENILLNALDHGAGTIEISATVDEGATVVVRNATRSVPGDRVDPRRGHGLEVIELAARQAGGSFAFHSDGAEAVATLALGPGPGRREHP
jgi:signal transduction histidine kinase